MPPLPPGATVFSLLGLLLGMLLAFRTNTSYDRWWEGRKLWGALVNVSRNLALHLDSVLPADDQEHRLEFAHDLSNYAFALKGHLRGEVEFADLTGYSPELMETLKQVHHVPNAIAQRISRRLHDLLRRGVFAEVEFRAVRPLADVPTDVMGACERIRSTPVPYPYDAYVKLMVLLYCLVLPIALHPDFGWGVIGLSMVAYAAMAGIAMLAADIEDPFGTDENDLPTHRISLTIRKSVFEILTASVPVGEQVPRYDGSRLTVAS